MRYWHGVDLRSKSGENGSDIYNQKRHGPNVESTWDVDPIYEVSHYATGGKSGNTFKKGTNAIEKAKAAAEMANKVKEGAETGGNAVETVKEVINENRNRDPKNRILLIENVDGYRTVLKKNLSETKAKVDSSELSKSGSKVFIERPK